MQIKDVELGRVFGIRFAVDWSVVFVCVLIAFHLGVAVFPAWHPEWGFVVGWMVAIGAAGLFLGSLFAHELAHAIAANAFGLRVRHVTLLLFGGISDVEDDPKTPKQETLLAAVGPATSFVLGLVLALLGSVLVNMPPELGDDRLLGMQRVGPLATLFVWLGPINVLIALANVIPAYPLDGGRVVRAALWSATGDREKATRWAALAGQVAGWLLIVVGLGLAFAHGTSATAGIWLAFFGWFLNAAAAGAAPPKREVTAFARSSTSP